MTHWNKILVIGCGGTGSILTPQLVRFLRSKNFGGVLIFADGDSYSETNSDRQLFNLSKIGMNKAEYQANAVMSQLPDIPFDLEFLPEYLSKDDIANMITDKTIVINCADNAAIRKYVEDVVCSMSIPNVAHICCGNELRNGQVQISIVKNSNMITPSIFNRSPNFNNENDDRSKMDCEQIANLPSGGQIIATNMMAASIALSFVVQLFSDNIIHNYGQHIPTSTIYFDIFTLNFDEMDKYDFTQLINIR